MIVWRRKRASGNAWMVGLAAGVLALAASSAAQANNIWIEAEAAMFQGNRLTPPMHITDIADASSGSYIEVNTGNNSQSAPPVNGVATYHLFVAEPGTFRIWARVIAPDTGSDSFWVRVNGGAWINWNNIPLGNGWHWAQVKANGSSQAATFSLGNGSLDIIDVAYREDGAKLDVMVVTDDPTFNPAAPPAGVPPAPAVASLPVGRGSARVEWAEVPGANSYTIKRRVGAEPTFQNVAVGVVGHVFTQGGLPTDQTVCYEVHAESPSGLGAGTEVCGDPNRFQFTDDVAQASLTAPMRLTDTFTVSVVPGNNSLNAPPAAPNGRALYYFQTPLATQLKVWVGVIAPSPSHDSFWVRMDNGPFIKWNNIQPLVGCFDFADVRDSDHANQPVIFAVQPGSHSLEFAYREDLTELSENLVVWDDLSSTTPSCDD